MSKLGDSYAAEIEGEAAPTRKCIERIPIDKVFEWKPHPKSMKMGYLTILCADMLRWIDHMITGADIDLETWKIPEVKTSQDLVRFFDETLKRLLKTLRQVNDEDLEGDFTLRHGQKVIFTMQKKDVIRSTINHWAHHRGQLTVYMRLNEIAVPAIYGSSADEKVF